MKKVDINRQYRKINKFYQNLERQIGPEKAKEIDIMLTKLFLSTLDGEVETLENVRSMIKQFDNRIKAYIDQIQYVIKKSKSGD